MTTLLIIPCGPCLLLSAGPALRPCSRSGPLAPYRRDAERFASSRRHSWRIRHQPRLAFDSGIVRADALPPPGEPLCVACGLKADVRVTPTATHWEDRAAPRGAI